MRSFLDIFVLWPMPALWLALAGFVLWFAGRRGGQVVVAAALALLFATAVPIVARLLNAGLMSGAPPYVQDSEAAACAGAIVVPTAGSYVDATGRAHPMDATVRRASAGQMVARRTGLPLIVAGGAPGRNEPAEAAVVVAHLGLVDAIVEAQPRDTHETGLAVARRLDDIGVVRAVVLVTDAVHVARAAAVLRHAGVRVCAAVAVDVGGTGASGFWPGPWHPSHLVPGASAFGISRRAIYEYIGIATYMVLGRIDPGDL